MNFLIIFYLILFAKEILFVASFNDKAFQFHNYSALLAKMDELVERFPDFLQKFDARKDPIVFPNLKSCGSDP